MNIFNVKQMFVVNNNAAIHLALMLGTMLVTGLVIAFVVHALFSWAPLKFRQQISATLGCIGVIIPGLWLAVKLFDHM